MTPKEESDIRLQDSQADCAYIAAGAVKHLGLILHNLNAPD